MSDGREEREEQEKRREEEARQRRDDWIDRNLADPSEPEQGGS